MRNHFSKKLFLGSLLPLVIVLFFTLCAHYLSLSTNTSNFIVHAQDDAGGDQSGGEAGDAGGSEGDAGGEAGDATSEGDVGTESPGDDGGDGQEEAPSADPQDPGSSEGFEPQGPGDAGFDLGPQGNLMTDTDPAGLEYTDSNGDIVSGPVGSLPADQFNDLTGGAAGVTAVHTDGGWFTCDCSPQTEDPGTSGPPDTLTGDGNTGNTGNGGGDNPSNTGDPPCVVNCSPTPPGAFTQNPPEVLSCQATSNNPVIKTSWTSSSNFTRYIMYYLDSADPANQIRLDRYSTEGYNFDSSKLIPGHSYSFVIIAVNNQNFQTGSDADAAHPFGMWSHEKFNSFTTFPDCSPAPIVTLRINNTQSGGFPAKINQNDPASLSWEARNIDTGTCRASVTSGSANPVPGNVSNLWRDGKPESGGPVSIPTSEPGSVYIFNLTCKKNSVDYPASIQLNIRQFPPAYFQTTGGDVHTNETIYISPR